MNLEDEVIIPTFINIHVFWIIRKKEICLRTALHRLMAKRGCKIFNSSELIPEEEIVAINVDGIWARARIESILQESSSKYLCWLLDYGIMRCASSVFHLPEGLEKCPHLAKQASLHNVVNLATDLVFGESGYELKLKKTCNDNQGVRQNTLDYLEGADKICFTQTGDNESILYGDIILWYKDNTKASLIETLIQEDLLAIDETMFENRSMEVKRRQFKNAYFQHSPNWQQKLDLVEKKILGEIIFNHDKNEAMECFTRR